MKDLFPGYARKSIDYKEIWRTALFVFDTNALLNAYRYKKSARDALLNAIRALGAQVWIPYHVALEYHRGRLSVIATQMAQFDELQTSLQESVAEVRKSAKSIESRHSLIDCSEFLKELDGASSKLSDSLKDLRLQQQDLQSEDPTLYEIERIFDGKVGDAPTEDRLKALYKEAELRKSTDRPPGYKDAAKKDAFHHNGMQYNSSHGDYIIWAETLDYCKANGVANLVFVTDDAKDDWLRRVAGQTLGPRAELVEEARSYGIDNFQINNSTIFVERAREFFQSDEITNEIVKEISEQSHTATELSDETQAHLFSTIIQGDFFSRVVDFLLTSGYKISHKFPSTGWFTAKTANDLSAVVHIINCKRFHEMLSAVSMLSSVMIKEVTLGSYDQALVFVNCSNHWFEMLKIKHPKLLSSVLSAEAHHVFFGFADGNSNIHAPLSFFNSKSD